MGVGDAHYGTGRPRDTFLEMPAGMNPTASNDLTLRDLDLEEHLADPARRQTFVTRMFDIIAPRYDRFTRVFSYAMDARWKQELLSPLADLPAGSRIVDLACGTGDLAFAAAEYVRDASVLGVDASSRMIDGANARKAQRNQQAGVTFTVGDMLDIPASAGAVDAVTAGYGFRNVPDATQAVREVSRVLRPGGLLLTLDFYRPRNAIWRALFLWYLRVAGNLVGWLWHREPVVYGYIASSIDAFMSWQDFSALLEREGFEIVSVRRKLLGGVALHSARRRTVD